MAKVDIKMPDAFLEKLAHLARDEDGMAERVLNAGAEVVEAKVRSNLAGVIGRGTKEESRSTGQLLSALGTSPVKVDRNGNHDVKIGFASRDETETAMPKLPIFSNTADTDSPQNRS